MQGVSSEKFGAYLLEKYSLPAGRAAGAGQFGAPAVKALRELWESTDLPAAEFADEVARFFNLQRIGLLELLATEAQVEGFSRRFLWESMVVPFRSAGGAVKLAGSDPRDTAAIRAAEIVFGDTVELVIASFEDITTILERLDGGGSTAAEADERPHSDDDIDSLRDLASGAPVVRAFSDLIERAVELRASDIHIEPFRDGLTVRMRVDGMVRAMPAPPGVMPQALVSRIKILAGLNIAERRLPQDGAARLRVGRSEIDVRVATMPTQHGESAAVRLLPRDLRLLDMTKLGLSSHDESVLKKLLALPHGMIVITGPTGSGKTTTLATMLSILNETSRKILTIEDPVEYEIPGINQSQVKPSIGLTFATALRAFVRQDPDVIMVGEIRDAETANIAIHAALTGHLVLTKLHTDTAPPAVPRLLDLGVEGFLLKSTLRAVIAQRLVRMLCDRCKTQHKLSADDLARDPRYGMVGFAPGDVVHEACGCERCGASGFRGRGGVFEVLEIADEVRNLIGSHTDANMLDQAAIKAGMTTMLDDAIAKCRAGVTTVPETLRVTTVR